jgi:hypothetical protein
VKEIEASEPKRKRPQGTRIDSKQYQAFTSDKFVFCTVLRTLIAWFRLISSRKEMFCFS